MPTWAEFEAYDRRSRQHGLASYRPYLPIGWTCPCCGRTRFQLLRWGTWNRGHTTAIRLHGRVGWVEILVEHHDHGPESNGYFEIHGMPIRERRFENVVICNDCNIADARIKGNLALPAWWTFTIDEIRQFITPRPHAMTELRPETAETIFYQNNLVDHPDAPDGIPNAALRARMLENRLEERKSQGLKGLVYGIGI